MSVNKVGFKMINQCQLVDVLSSLTEDDFKQVDEVLK